MSDWWDNYEQSLMRKIRGKDNYVFNLAEVEEWTSDRW